jgi:hypothetical protein
VRRFEQTLADLNEKRARLTAKRDKLVARLPE